MKESIRQERLREKAMAILLAAGHKAEDVKAAVEKPLEHREAVSRQGEAVLLFLEHPAKFTTKQCMREECGEWFGTNYRSVGYCSDNCRAHEIERILGVKWDWHKPQHERWGGEPPLIIDPDSLKILARHFADLKHQYQVEQRIIEDQRQSNSPVVLQYEPYLPVLSQEDASVFDIDLSMFDDIQEEDSSAGV